MEHLPEGNLPGWLIPQQGALVAFAGILASEGVLKGLIGPREVPRLWSRHLMNCLVVAEPDRGLVPMGATVADVGSGAGLPGVAWAIARPDISVTLIEPLLRRSNFLEEVVAALLLSPRVQVRRGRGEEVSTDGSWVGVDVVTARAVAPLDKLLGWTIPLLRTGGALVALKGNSAAGELDTAQQVAAVLGVRDLRIELCGVGEIEIPTTVVLGTKGATQ